MGSLTFTPLHKTFGAECNGVDFQQPLCERTVTAIRDGMADYGVLVFRRTGLDDDGHEQFALRFGDPDLSAVAVTRRAGRLANSKILVDVSNVGPNGRVMPVESTMAKVSRGNNLFHVDCSYNPRRAGYSILRADQLPPPGHGGSTQFADTRTAYDELHDEFKDQIKDFVICHSIMHSRRVGAPDIALFRWLRIRDFPHRFHRLVQQHEPSGRTNLYIASHVHHIEGMSEEDSRPIIQELLRHASRDEHVLTVEWESKGDLDNTCVMHRAGGGSFEGRYVRDLRRATVYDSSADAYGLPRPQPWGIKWTFWFFMLLHSVDKFWRSLATWGTTKRT
ncbi:uncharacterized protein RHO25_004709 [Cercospora beticola]|uniref:TauD/TfdA-like domain-containing protein n=1 Tax=Cercospora beticola TaxID=122368 RepID=A0ABZ0NKT8_CERBT|nr:hypothetical protein RHO25_004709 [Cercospora beticola]CAK1361727.1 unnamed protein product [Cercospora beticola]